VEKNESFFSTCEMIVVEDGDSSGIACPGETGRAYDVEAHGPPAESVRLKRKSVASTKPFLYKKGDAIKSHFQ